MQFARIAASAVAAVTISFAGAASAVPIDTIFNVAALGGFTANTGDITTATSISNGAPTLVGQIVQDNTGLTAGQAVTLSSTIGLSVGDVFTKEFTTANGTFLETLTVTTRDAGPSGLNILAIGTIMQTAGTGFDPVSVFWSAAYTQNAGPGGQINGSFNNSTTPPSGVVPEPSALALVGLALVGLALTRNSKKA